MKIQAAVLHAPQTSLRIETLSLKDPCGDEIRVRLVEASVDMQARGRILFEKLVQMYPFEQVKESIADSKSGKTAKPTLKFLHD
ncbi:MAG: NAD(P)-dependent alcohol dehydrogenase [Polaromonas sp.]|jgi:Zn-dependent alcohol dehydrogenase|nr:NAD(P)-dependent alcohol dehydrogenase [Polaromonas sp.]